MTSSILIVEDEFVISMEIEKRLTLMGYRVAGSADNGARALELIDQTRPDLILMDIQIKGDRDGIETAYEIRKKYRLPVIFLTAYAEDETLERAKLAEPYGYILKPFEQRDLKSAIEIALYRHGTIKAEENLKESEERLRLFIEHAPAALAMFDCGMHYLSASRRWMKDYNLLQDDVTGRSHYEIFPEISEEWKAVHRRGLAGEVIRAEEDRFARADGSVQWLRWEVRPWRDVNGNVGGIIIFSEDISDRKNAEETLKESEKKNRFLANIIRMGSQPVAVGYPDGKLGLINNAFEHLLGYSFEELQTINWSTELTPPEWLPMERERLEKLEKTGKPVRYEKEFIRKNGGLVPVELFVHYAKDQDGKPEFYYAYITDITERKQVEEQFRASEKRNRQILHTAMDGYFRADRHGRILEANQAYSRMSGYSIPELLSMTIADIDDSIKSDDLNSQMLKIIVQGETRFEYRNRRKDGSVYDVEVSVQTREENGAIEFVAFLRDITQRKTLERVQAAKLRLIDFASTYSTREFLQELLDEAEALTGSKIGFFHFVEEDQETLTLQTWSTNTLKNMCKAEGRGNHYPISQAGVWVDCVKEGKPLIHNDYARLPIRKGLPEGHAPVIRELVIPVLRNGKIVAILGVGNKATDYHAQDVDTVWQLADLSWDTVIIKRAEDALRESEERYRSMMEAMNDGAFICSHDFRIEYLNPAMIRQIGWDALGEKCYETIHGLDSPCPWCTMDANQRGERTEIEVECPKNGRYYVVSNSPIFHSEGSVSQMAIYRDITQIRNVENQLRQAQKLEALGTLSAGIAHDFNNILFPITGLSELMMEDLPEGSFQWDNASEILNSARRAADLVKQILSFSRQGEKMRVPIRVQQIMKEVFKLMRSTIPSNIPMKQSIQQDCPPVMADPTQLHQITMNLVTNAYHAVEENGGEIMLGLRWAVVPSNGQPDIVLEPGDYAVLSVSDTGKGIDPAHLDNIFEPYFTTKKEGKGTGLGLSVVYGIIKEHGGDVAVINEPGKGVRFDVYLPVLETAVSAGSKKETHESLPTGNERILLVDDEELIVKFEEKLLRRLGYQVTTFTRALDARDAFKKDPNRYDLVVSDMAMPHTTGVQLAEELRSIRPELPIIICTGYSERLDAEKAKSLGVNGFLMKPVKKTDMAGMIRKILDESHFKKL
jgi:PAS domain S-box-containing protein